MKKMYFFIILCSISSSNLFSAQKKETTQERQDRETRNLIDSWARQESAEKERDAKIRKELYCEQHDEIARLKQSHATEIDSYQKKIETLMTQLEAFHALHNDPESIIKNIQAKNPNANKSIQ